MQLLSLLARENLEIPYNLRKHIGAVCYPCKSHQPDTLEYCLILPEDIGKQASYFLIFEKKSRKKQPLSESLLFRLGDVPSSIEGIYDHKNIDNIVDSLRDAYDNATLKPRKYNICISDPIYTGIEREDYTFKEDIQRQIVCNVLQPTEQESCGLIDIASDFENIFKDNDAMCDLISKGNDILNEHVIESLRDWVLFRTMI